MAPRKRPRVGSPRRSPRRARARALASPPARLVPRHIDLREVPHAHAVCRQCGRITEVALAPFDIAQLTALASGSPEEWSVDGISLSLTGLCPRCRSGTSAP
jgi:hypothetical protein